PTPSITLAKPATVIANVVASPMTIASGRRRPPVAPADSSAGSTGSTHGEIEVPAPAKNANSTSSVTRLRVDPTVVHFTPPSSGTRPLQPTKEAWHGCFPPT